LFNYGGCLFSINRHVSFYLSSQGDSVIVFVFNDFSLIFHQIHLIHKFSALVFIVSYFTTGLACVYLSRRLFILNFYGSVFSTLCPFYVDKLYDTLLLIVFVTCLPHIHTDAQTDRYTHRRAHYNTLQLLPWAKYCSEHIWVCLSIHVCVW